MFFCNPIAIERPRPPHLRDIRRNGASLQLLTDTSAYIFDGCQAREVPMFSLYLLGYSACAIGTELCWPSITTSICSLQQAEKFLHPATLTWQGADVWMDPELFFACHFEESKVSNSWSYIWVDASLTDKVRMRGVLSLQRHFSRISTSKNGNPSSHLWDMALRNFLARNLASSSRKIISRQIGLRHERVSTKKNKKNK